MLDQSSPIVNAPMPRRITKVLVKEGDVVKPRKHLIVLEAMTMENVLFSGYAGTVSKIPCKVGEQVREGQMLVQIEQIHKIQEKKVNWVP